MDFFALNRKVERILRKGDATQQETTYEENVNRFYRKTSKNSNLKKGNTLTAENGTKIATISKDLDSKLIVFSHVEQK